MSITGSVECDQLMTFQITGDIIPRSWYKTITKKNSSGEKPHLLAISILGEIVYWYRPTEIRDEHTGEITGYKKKFASDLLQKTYDELAKTYGCSKDTITEAIVFLEKLGVIKREFRTITIGNIVCNNVLYIRLIVTRLKELTYPSGEISPEVSGKGNDSSPEKSVRPKRKKSETNTENTSQNTAENTSFVKNSPADSDDGDYFAEIESGNRTVPIPEAYAKDSQKVHRHLAALSDWTEKTPDHFKTNFEFKTFRAIIDNLSLMITATRQKIYDGTPVSDGSVVLNKVNACIIAGEFTLFIEQTIEAYVSAARINEIRNATAYLQAVIWTTLSNYAIKFESFFEHSYNNYLTAKE